MMLGEMDFVGTYVQPFYTNQLTFPIPAFILLCEYQSIRPTEYIEYIDGIYNLPQVCL